jgi:long-chain fatty acid transport protein
MSIGLSVYGNGGMNTSYANSSVTCNNNGQSYPANVLCGTTALGVNLTQLIIAPTFAIKLNENSSIGISPLIVRQTFSASGLQAFDTSYNSTSTSTNPGHVTDNGNSDSNGFGLRLGYLIKLNETVSFGASYAPKITMSKFSGYSGLFANSGEFDIPENYALGFSFNTSPTSQWLIDYQRINYGNVAATGNPSGPPPFNLGAANGAGFGWNNIDILKIGYQWQPNENLALRVGYNHSQNPITSSNVTFNILAPGVITNHYTVGGTFAIDKDHEVSFAYMYAPYNSVSGSSMMNTLGQTSNATDTIRMSEQSLGIQFGWKF